MKSCLALRGINSDLPYPVCKQEMKTILHILRDCEVIKQVWWKLSINSNDNVFFYGDSLSWFVANAKSKSRTTRE